MAKEVTKPDVPVKVTLPERIMLARLHGFIDENGRHRQWFAGDVVTDADEIELLTSRKATFEAV